jgi:hypothetical protein
LVAFSPDGMHVLTGAEDRTTRWWDVTTGSELAEMISLGGGKEWLVVTPEGLFDGSDRARELVCFRVGNALRPVPVDRLFQDFFYPGLLAAIWRGERPMPKRDFPAQQPPTLRIISPQSGTVEAGRVTIEVEAVDQGGGIGPTPFLRRGVSVAHRDDAAEGGGIGSITIFQNDTLVASKGAVQRAGKTLRQTFVIELVRGKNRLVARAASADGSWEAEPADIILKYQGP